MHTSKSASLTYIHYIILLDFNIRFSLVPVLQFRKFVIEFLLQIQLFTSIYVWVPNKYNSKKLFQVFRYTSFKLN